MKINICSYDEHAFTEYTSLIKKNFAQYNTKREFIKSKPLDRYVEKHHIIPISLGGSDGPNNLVWLSATDHFMAHYLLYKFTRTREMCFAFNQMKRVSSNASIMNSAAEYAQFREDLSKHLSVMRKESEKTMTPEKKEARSKRLSNAGKGHLVVRIKATGKTTRINKTLFDPSIHEPEQTGRTHSKTTKDKIGHANSTQQKGNAYHNPNTKHIIYIKPSDEVPLGYIKGSGVPNTHTKGTKFYHNPITHETGRFLPTNVPEGWVPKRLKTETNPFVHSIVRIDPITTKTIFVKTIQETAYTGHTRSEYMFTFVVDNVRYATSTVSKMAKMLNTEVKTIQNYILTGKFGPRIKPTVTSAQIKGYKIGLITAECLNQLKFESTWVF